MFAVQFTIDADTEFSVVNPKLTLKQLNDPNYIEIEPEIVLLSYNDNIRTYLVRCEYHTFSIELFQKNSFNQLLTIYAQETSKAS